MFPCYRKVIGLDTYKAGRIRLFAACFLLIAFCYLSAIAQDTTFEDARRAFSNRFGNQGWASNFTLLVIAICIVAGIVLVSILVERYYRSRNTKNGYFSHNRLFRELCQAHEFTNEQQVILKNIARELQLESPVVLFIEPKHLELALTESVVASPPELIRQIFKALFSYEAASPGAMKEEDNTWFAWTKVTENPEADQLKREPKKERDKRDTPESLTELPQTRQWDPSLWQEVQQTAPAPTEPEQTTKEKPGYKPRYPETEMQDALVHQSPGGQVSSNIGDQKKNLPKTPPSPGAQILSSMLYSVSDVTNELAYSSIRNHLTRSLSLSPQSLGEMKPRVTEATSAVPLEEIMVLPQRSLRSPDTQTQVETKTEPKVAIRQVELKSIDLKPPTSFWDGE